MRVDLHVTSITKPVLSSIVIQSFWEKGLSILTKIPESILLKFAWIAKPRIAARTPDVARMLVSSKLNSFDRTINEGIKKIIIWNTKVTISGTLILLSFSFIERTSYL